MSKKKDAAVEFIKYTVSPEAQLLNFQQFTNFPEPAVRRQTGGRGGQGQQAAWLAQLETTIATGKEWPKLPGFSRVCTLMFDGDRAGDQQPGDSGRLAQSGSQRSLDR